MGARHIYHERCASCTYRGAVYCVTKDSINGCDYLLFTGKSRLAQVLKRLQTKELTRQVKRMLRPEHCPFYRRGERMKVRNHITVRT